MNSLRIQTYTVLAVFIWAIGCTPSSSESQTTLETIQQAKTVKIGYANEAPYAYKDTQTGALTGEAPKIASVILNQLGVEEVEGVLTEFGSLIPGLKAGRFDLIAAGMYIKPKRCGEISFSNPTYGIGEAFAVQRGNPKNLHSYEDIVERNDATIGVVSGAVERGYARAVGIPDERIKVFPDAPSAIAGVKAGRVDAYAGTALTVQDLINKESSGKVERATPFSDPIIKGQMVKGYGAFGFRKEDTQLIEAFNGKLASFIGSAKHLEIIRPFGFTENELPGEITAEALCQGAQ